MSKFFSSCFIICYLTITGHAQSAHTWLRKADKAYEKEEYARAEEGYRKSIEKNNALKANYNLGNSTYMQDRFEEAIEHYTDALDMANTDQEKSNAHYNLANSLFKNGKLEESIKSYKNALILDPEDDEIRKNLFIAKLMEQKQQQQKEQKDENEKQDQNPNEQNPNQQQDQQKSEHSSQENEDEIVSDQEIQDQQAELQGLSKEDALKLLKVIENEEKNVQAKLRKVSGKKKNVKKDW